MCAFVCWLQCREEIFELLGADAQPTLEDLSKLDPLGLIGGRELADAELGEPLHDVATVSGEARVASAALRELQKRSELALVHRLAPNDAPAPQLQDAPRELVPYRLELQDHESEAYAPQAWVCRVDPPRGIPSP